MNMRFPTTTLAAPDRGPGMSPKQRTRRQQRCADAGLRHPRYPKPSPLSPLLLKAGAAVLLSAPTPTPVPAWPKKSENDDADEDNDEDQDCDSCNDDACCPVNAELFVSLLQPSIPCEEEGGTEDPSTLVLLSPGDDCCLIPTAPLSLLILPSLL